MLSKNEQNKAVVRRFWKAYEANDQATLNEVLSPALVAQSPNTPIQQNRVMHLQGISMFNAAFTDRHFTVEELLAEGDVVATRTTLRGIHTGDFQGHAPTGKELVATGLTLERIKDGKIVERWFSFEVERVKLGLGFVMPPQAYP
jgi:predicted ester cyclase